MAFASSVKRWKAIWKSPTAAAVEGPAPVIGSPRQSSSIRALSDRFPGRNYQSRAVR